jgi:hypothetical protein
MPFFSRARDRSGNPAENASGVFEELQRIARFPALRAGNAPK